MSCTLQAAFTTQHAGPTGVLHLRADGGRTRGGTHCTRTRGRPTGKSPWSTRKPTVEKPGWFSTLFFFFSIISLVTDHIVVCAVSGVSGSAPARPARGRDGCPRSAAAWASQGPHRPSGTALACCFTRCDQDVAISPTERVPFRPSHTLTPGLGRPGLSRTPSPRHSGEQPPTHAAVSLPGGLHLLATRDFYLLNPSLMGWQK